MTTTRLNLLSAACGIWRSRDDSAQPFTDLSLCEELCPSLRKSAGHVAQSADGLSPTDRFFCPKTLKIAGINAILSRFGVEEICCQLVFEFLWPASAPKSGYPPKPSRRRGKAGPFWPCVTRNGHSLVNGRWELMCEVTFALLIKVTERMFPGQNIWDTELNKMLLSAAWLSTES